MGVWDFVWPSTSRSWHQTAFVPPWRARAAVLRALPDEAGSPQCARHLNTFPEPSGRGRPCGLGPGLPRPRRTAPDPLSWAVAHSAVPAPSVSAPRTRRSECRHVGSAQVRGRPALLRAVTPPARVPCTDSHSLPQEFMRVEAAFRAWLFSGPRPAAHSGRCSGQCALSYPAPASRSEGTVVRSPVLPGTGMRVVFTVHYK